MQECSERMAMPQLDVYAKVDNPSFRATQLRQVNLIQASCLRKALV